MTKILTLTCPNCNNLFNRYKSTIKSNIVFCSRNCKDTYNIKNKLCSGINNNNYKHGLYCTTSYCKCGNPKDYRAEKCFKCSNVSYSKSNIIKRDYNEELILETVPFVKSFVELSKLTKHPRHIVTKIINNNNIDISHFRNKYTKKDVLKSMFIDKSSSIRNTLRKNIIKYNLIKYNCSKCGISNIYNDLPIVIQLHHKDGNRYNNKLNNLEFLCPNCHSQTSTFCGANKKYN